MRDLIEPFITAGVDVGTRSVKMVLLAHGPGAVRVLAREITPIEDHRDTRYARVAIRDAWSRALGVAGLSRFEVSLVASTGRRNDLLLGTGQFHSRVSQIHGARLLYPDAAVVLDIGVFRSRCVVAGAENQIRTYQVALGDGDCAPPGLPRRDSLAGSAVAILRAAGANGNVVLVGGMVRDAAFVSTLTSRMVESGLQVQLLVSLDADYAAAYGAALLVARRYRRLTEPLPVRLEFPLNRLPVKSVVLN